MNARPALRLAALFSPLLALLAVGVLFVVRQYESDDVLPPDAGGRLVVLIVVDQLRGDTLTRWSPLFGTGGFERLKREGVWYSDCHIPYAVTTTAPGHATIATGQPPRVHGVIDNAWFERGQAAPTYAVTGARPFDQVPPGNGGGQSPQQLSTPTVGDTLAGTGGGRVVSVALKDRAAVMLGGHTPVGAYWLAPSGEFVTTTYYRETLPSWAERFNALRLAAELGRPQWDRLLDGSVYEAHAKPNPPGQQSFPHPVLAPNTTLDAIGSSPAGNELLWKFAQAAIDGESLGRSGGTDLLCVGLSANDLIGHQYGPDSPEVLDVTLRTDRLVAVILADLETRLGPDRFTLILTADHGVCPLPENAQTEHPEAARFDPVAAYAPLETALGEAFGVAKDGTPWLEAVHFPWLVLNQNRVTASGLDRDQVERFAAQWCVNRPAVAAAAFPRADLTGVLADDPLLRAAQLSYQPDRAGDVYLLQKPYMIPRSPATPTTGTTHGTPYRYDTHIPLLAVGHRVPKIGEQTGRVSSLAVGPVLAHCLDLGVPVAFPDPLPAGWAGQ